MNLRELGLLEGVRAREQREMMQTQYSYMKFSKNKLKE